MQMNFPAIKCLGFYCQLFGLCPDITVCNLSTFFHDVAELAGQQAKLGATNLLFFIALISVNLAILNVLPIPVLDGGHLLFFAIEMIIGKPVSIRVREVAQQTGMFVLILLMIFVF